MKTHFTSALCTSIKTITAKNYFVTTKTGTSANSNFSFLLAGGLVAAGGFGYWFTRSYFPSTAVQKQESSADKIETALNPSEFIPFKLLQRQDISHDTAFLRFAFPSSEMGSGLSVASCLVVKAECDVESRETGVVEKKTVIRPYTPVSGVQEKGYLDLVIKRYPKGAMSRHIFDMKEGDSLLFKGPFPKISYEANKWKHVAMIAGGTGITPMYQVLSHALGDTTDSTKFTLLYGNMTENDILLKKELDELQKKYPSRLAVFYHLSKPSSSWKGWKGFQSAEMIKSSGIYLLCSMRKLVAFPKPNEADTMIFVCGSPVMMNSVSGDKAPDKSQGEIKPDSILGKLGYSKDQVFKF